MRRLSRGFWIALLTVPIPIVVLLVVASIYNSQPGSRGYWEAAFVALGALGWWALSLVTAIAFSVWVRGKVTLGLWTGLLIAAVIYVLLSILVVGWLT